VATGRGPVIAGNPAIATDLVVLSWAFLGMGAVLYLVVTATLFMRSISHPCRRWGWPRRCSSAWVRRA
jgi:peptidoglycan/LPS O-acetylase OafA/YrhL